jgi:hypothetical protein
MILISRNTVGSVVEERGQSYLNGRRRMKIKCVDWDKSTNGGGANYDSDKISEPVRSSVSG